MRPAHHHSIVGLAILVVLGWSSVAHAVGEQNGRLRGVVTEAQTGAPVPGATVTVRGRSLIGGPQTRTTDEDGSYEFTELPPGPYTVEVTYSGIKPVVRRVVVVQGQTVPLDIAWSPELATTETTVVREERHLTRPDSTQTGTVITADTESKLATARRYADVASQVAGVNTAGGSVPTFKGSRFNMNHYLVDGMDITDSISNNFNTQVNFDSIGSVEVITGGMEAQYNSIGGVINLITNAGSDEFHVDSSLYVNNSKFNVANQFGQRLYDYAEPFSTTPTGPTQSYQANISVGGPILKRRLWYNLAIEYDYSETSIPAATVFGVPLQHPARVFHNFYPRAKFTWAPSAKHRITLSANGDPAFDFYRDQSNQELAIAESGQRQGGAFTVLQWDFFASQNLNFNLQAGYNWNGLHQSPQGQLTSIDYGPRVPGLSDKNYRYDPNQPRHTNRDDNTNWYQGGLANNNNNRHTIQVDPSVSLRGRLAGLHDAKFGVQTRTVVEDYKQHIAGIYAFTESGGGPGEAGLCDPSTGTGCNNNTQRRETPDYKSAASGFSFGIFAQDRWKVFRRLTLVPGIRFDWGITKNYTDQTVSRLFGFGPRFGFTFDITGDQKTILSGYYGRANEVLSLTPAIYASPQSTVTTCNWSTTLRDFDPTTCRTSSGSGGYVLDPDHTTTPPHTDELTGSIVREFFRNSIATVTYTYKKVSNIYDTVETNQIWDPSGYRLQGYVNGQPQQIFKYTTPDQAFRTYHGVDFVVESRPTPNWDVYVAYTLSWLWGTGDDSLSSNNVRDSNPFYNPRMYKYFPGFLRDDQRHVVKFHGSYDWNGLTLGGTFLYASGTPITKQFQNPVDATTTARRSPTGTEPFAPNDSASISEFRNPDLIVVNARASYDFYRLIHSHVIFIVDLFNLFNLSQPTSLENRDGATFGAANRGRQAPFRLQLGLRYIY